MERAFCEGKKKGKRLKLYAIVNMVSITSFLKLAQAKIKYLRK
jgi:hypothetical protein